MMFYKLKKIGQRTTLNHSFKCYLGSYAIFFLFSEKTGICFLLTLPFQMLACVLPLFFLPGSAKQCEPICCAPIRKILDPLQTPRPDHWLWNFCLSSLDNLHIITSSSTGFCNALLLSLRKKKKNVVNHFVQYTQ